MKLTNALPKVPKAPETTVQAQFTKRQQAIFKFFNAHYIDIANWTAGWDPLPKGFKALVKMTDTLEPGGRAPKLPKSIAKLVAETDDNISVVAARPKGLKKACYAALIQDVRNATATFMAFDEKGNLAGQRKISG